MKYQNVFQRYELKYLLTRMEYWELLSIMENYMTPDKFGNSVINNLYFDTPDRLLIRRSLDKPCYKEKLRVRSYGIAKGEDPVFVELKKKFKGVVYKRRLEMQAQTAVNYLEKHWSLPKPTQISKEIDYLMQIYPNLEPSMFLAYEREAFFSQSDKNFRLTFDQNILARSYDLDLSSGIYGENILDPNKVLLEVKTALGMPKWLLEFFSQNKIYKISYSKYGNAYKQLLLAKTIGGANDAA